MNNFFTFFINAQRVNNKSLFYLIFFKLSIIDCFKILTLFLDKTHFNIKI